MPGHVAVTEQTVNAYRHLMDKMEWNNGYLEDEEEGSKLALV